MRLKMLSLRHLLSALLFVSVISLAEDDNWQTIGSAKARSTRQIITIPVPESFQDQNIATIRFHVSEGNLKAHYARLTLSDGNKLDVSIQRMIRSGHNSRIIPVEIGGRNIKKVSLYYEVQPKETVLVSLQVQLTHEY